MALTAAIYILITLGHVAGMLTAILAKDRKHQTLAAWFALACMAVQVFAFPYEVVLSRYGEILRSRLIW